MAAIELLHNVKELRFWFNLIDRDGGGCIDMSEFMEFTSSLGARIEEDMVKKIKALDTDGDGTIDFLEFAVILADPDAAELQNNIRFKMDECSGMFEVFDLNKNSFVSVDELMVILRSLGLPVTDREVQMMVSHLRMHL